MASTSNGTPREENRPSSLVFLDAAEENLDGYEFHDYADEPAEQHDDEEEYAGLPELLDPISTDDDEDDTPEPRSRLPRAAKQPIDYSHMNRFGYDNVMEVLEEVVTLKEQDELEEHEFLHHWIYLTHGQRQTLGNYLKKGPHPDHAIKAAEDEVKSFVDSDLGEPVHWRNLSETERKRVLRGFMFLLDKYNSLGEWIKTKARFVCDGSAQQAEDCGITYSATIRPESLFITLNLQARFDLDARSFDIPQAFIKTPVPDDEIIHVELDPQTTQLWLKFRPQDAPYVSRDKLIIRLKKFLYGLKQSPNRFGERLQEFYVDHMGYQINPVDNRFFYKIDKKRKQFILVPVHVDDNYVAYTRNSYLIDELRQGFVDFFGGVTEEDGSTFLGLHIVHDRRKGEILLDMKAYLEGIYQKYGDWLQGLRGYKYPGPTSIFREVPDNENKVDPTIFKSVLMSFYFASRFVKPEVQVCCSTLARVQVPTDTHASQLRHVAGYVQRTIDDKIRIAPRDTQIGASIDAAFNVHPDGSSQIGMILTMGQSPIGFYSNRVKEIATSSTHAELLALYKGMTLVIWARDHLNAIGVLQEGPAIISQDNGSNLLMADPSSHCSFKNSRHLLVKYSWLRQLNQAGVFKNETVSTFDISSDLMTKVVAEPVSFQGKLLRAQGYWPTI